MPDDNEFTTEINPSEPIETGALRQTASAEPMFDNVDYLDYTLNWDRRSYTVSAKDKETLPAVVIILREYNGLPVTAIKENGFSDCVGLSILLFEEPSNIKTVNTHAFAGCTGLASIELPRSVETIGCGAFKCCSMLQQVYFKSKMPPSLGVGVFCKSSLYLNLYVPRCSAACYKINEDFRQYACLILPSPEPVPANLNYFNFTLNEDGESYAIAGKSELTLPAELVLPSVYNQKPVTVIGDGAFLGRPIRELVIPDVITRIERSAFAFPTTRYYPDIIRGDSILERVTFGKNSSLSYIGDMAFTGSIKLMSFDIPKKVSFIDEYAFFSNGFTEIDIPENVETIGDNVFFMALNLKRITVDRKNKYYRSVDGILYNKDQTALIAYPMGKGDFRFCVSEELTDFGPQRFWGCQGLRVLRLGSVQPPAMHADFTGMLPSFTIYVPAESYEDYVSAPGWSTYQSIIYPDSIIKNGLAIDHNVLIQYAENGTEITLPKAVEKIRDFALTSCTNLAGIGVEDGSEYFSASDGVLYNADMTRLVSYPPARLANWYSLLSTTKTVGMAAFFGCERLAGVSVHRQLETIEDYAFFRCFGLKNLVNLDAADNIKTVGSRAFFECTAIEEVTLWALESLASSVFSLCYGMKIITFGPNVQDMDILISPFQSDPVSVVYNVYALTPPSLKNVNYTAVKALYVPAESIELYQATSPWSVFADRIYPLTLSVMK
jgi:hypothetical protein